MWLTLRGHWSRVDCAEKATCRAFSPDREGFMGTSRGGQVSQYHGPDLEDIQKLWSTLTEEFITDLEVRIELPPRVNPSFRPRLVLVSPGVEPVTGGVKWHTWATKELQAGFEAITYRQLFDLLIVGHRSIEAHLSGQRPLPLP